MKTAVYWDSSAVLSALGRDVHSEEALSWYRRSGIHLLSTLAYAESCAVLSRMKREEAITDETCSLAFRAMGFLPWRQAYLSPRWDELSEMAIRRTLRGADLWHLALALTLKRHDFPELRFLTYDAKLLAAAREEGLAPE